MSRAAAFVPVICCLLLLMACGTAVSVRPVRKGQSALAASLGGPVVNIGGIQAPVPYAVGRYRYGLSDNVGLYAGAHLLMPAFGSVGFDAGATWHFLEQNGAIPCLGGGAGIIGLVEADGGGGTKLLPAVEITASYLKFRRYITYVGVNVVGQVEPGFRATFAPYVGHEIRLSRSTSVTIEARWYAAYHRATPRAVIFSMPIANHGALGFVGGLNWQFGGWYR